MEAEKRTTRRLPREAEAEQNGPAQPGGEEILPRVRSWAGVAREALRDCERGVEAVKKIRLRRNRSGE